jgi:hypothetical protein
VNLASRSSGQVASALRQYVVDGHLGGPSGEDGDAGICRHYHFHGHRELAPIGEMSAIEATRIPRSRSFFAPSRASGGEADLRSQLGKLIEAYRPEP